MLIIQHAIIGLILSAVLLYDDVQTGIIFFLSSVLIDVDHFFSYWVYSKNFSLNYFKIKHWCLTTGIKMNLFFLFHNVWFFLILFLSSRQYTILQPVLLGVCLHFICDIIWDAKLFYAGKVKKPCRRWIC